MKQKNINIEVKVNREELKQKLNIQDGRTPKAGIDFPVPKDGSPDTGEQIIEKVNKDKSEKKIRKEKVEGLEALEDQIKTADQNSRYALRAAGDTVYPFDLSAQTNGVLKTFTVPQHRRIILVFGSDFPSVLFENNGFTRTATTITLTPTNAPSLGSQLGGFYVI